MTGPIQLEFLRERHEDIKRGTLAPKLVQWLCTHKCNFRCAHCGTAAAEAKPDELKTEEILPALEALAELGMEFLSLTGGEPMLRDDVWEIFARMKELGVKVGFVTNGYAVEKYKEEIRKAELDSVLVSIDGYAENHNKIRGMPGAYDRCIKALDYFKELGVPTRGVSTVYMPANFDDIPKIMMDVFRHGATRHRLQTIAPEGRAKGKPNPPELVKKAIKSVYLARQNGHPIEIAEDHGWLGPLDGKVRPPFFCTAGFNEMIIMHDGTVQGCPAIDYPEVNEGNIRSGSMKTIWKDGFGRFRGDHLADIPGECKECDYLKVCRGGCWIHRINKDYCYLPLVREICDELDIAWDV